MTTEPRTPPNDDAIPAWFLDFAQENARQHAELAAQIADVRLELASQIATVRQEVAALRVETAERENRLLKWMVGTVLAVATIWGGATYGIVTALTS